MKKRNFEPNVVICDLVKWIQQWFHDNGIGCNAIVGMSGGKDSTIAAAILAKALGSNRVIGVSMPDNGQGINDADKICEYIGIKYICCPIADSVTGVINSLHNLEYAPSNRTLQNIPPRIRMTTLYAIGQTMNGRVCNTCNYSEDYIGYSTRWGDSVGDFSPFANITVTELLQIGDALGLPYEWVHKTPDDGLPHSCPDEQKFGFTYATLDNYLLGIETPSDDIKEKIDTMHKNNEFKMHMMDSFPL